MPLFVNARLRLFYGWWIALSCCVITAVSSGVSFWSFGVFILPIEKEFGWLRGEIAGAFSIAWLVQGLLGPFIGRAVDRYGARPLIICGTLATGISCALLTTTTTLWQFYLFHILAAFCRSWMFYIPLNVLITRWFVRQRNVALAIFTSGFAVGGVLFVPLLTLMANATGWRGGYLFCGLVLYGVVLPLALWVLRSSPSELGLTSDGDAVQPILVPSGVDPIGPLTSQPSRPASPTILRSSLPAAQRHHWTVREALGTKAFWLIALGLSVTFLTQISFSIHSIAFFMSRGLTAGMSAGVVSASTAVVGLLRVPFGYALDRTTNVRAIMLLLILTQGIAVLVLLVSVEPIALWVFAALWGFTGAGMPLLESALIFRTFGERHYGSLLGTSGLVSTGGTICGPVLAGMVFDATGSYVGALLMFLAASLLSFGCFLAFRPPKSRAEREFATGAESCLALPLSGYDAGIVTGAAPGKVDL